MTLSYEEDQKNHPVIGIENTKVMVLQTANLTNSSSTVFPSSIDKKFEINNFIPEQNAIEKCSLNESFCIKVDNYPREDLSNLFRTSKFSSNPYYDVDVINEINDIEKRTSDDLLQSFCQSRTAVIYPEAGLTFNNEWRYIIQNPTNDNSSIKQGILVEKCVDTRVPCTFDSSLPLGYVSTCIQKYLYKRLITIGGKNEFYYDTFKMPSCCQCMYSANEDW
ncbi:PREDICTED: protein spaetzle-like [Diuraphis noxia]|uniref:protein spaetzle-like n=1 Tax=Diuraphis noxia TaxID=143948 RepID=UPI0007639799|nr:PREDICTED: protein spaetzle-like [Diuraphis noxia]